MTESAQPLVFSVMFLLNFLASETTTTIGTMNFNVAAAESWWRLHADEAERPTDRKKALSVMTRVLLVQVRAAHGLIGGKVSAITEEEPCVT